LARTEHYDDPAAPEPNSLVVAASAVVTDEQRRLLLQRRSDSGLWALPGGGMEMTDSLPGCVSRRFYDRKRAEGKRHTQAVLALARRRVNVLWALLRDGRCYEPAPPARAAA
jgi:ADP-ribose pyrophosphatase YjhB (NUDIX family)